jgi:hypothetical protein
MTRAIGPNQRRILDILREHGQPMTPSDILGALAPSERLAWEMRQPNLSQALTALARRGLVRVAGGDRLTADRSRRRMPITAVAIEPSLLRQSDDGCGEQQSQS